jgi:hypothetical protein
MRAIGAPTATITKLGKDWNRTSGQTFNKTWEGTQMQILALENDLKRDADSYEITTEGAKWIASARLTLDNPQFEVRVEAHPLHKSIFDPTLISGVTYADIAKIHDQIQSPDPGLDIDIFIATLSSPNAGDLFKLAFKGVTSKLIYQQFVILNITASPLYSFVENFRYDNVGLVLDTARMVGESGADSTGIPLPNFSFTNSGDDPVFNYGWLKHMPSCTRTTGGKKVFTAQWEYGLWPELVYALDTTVTT